MPYKFGDHDRDEADANRRNAERNQRYHDEVVARRGVEKPFKANFWIVGGIVAAALVLYWISLLHSILWRGMT